MPDTLTPALERQIVALRRPFAAFAERFGALSATRAELAPQFMRIFGAYTQQQAGGTFVAFVRKLDPEVPAERTAYRAHKSYQAAEYLRRLVARREPGGNRAPAAPATRSNLTALARALATILPLVRDVQVVWRAVESELGFTARQVGRLQQVVAATQPLLTLPNARPMTPRVVHMPPVNPVVATEPSRQTRATRTVARGARKRAA